MKWEELLRIVLNEPVFPSSLLLAGSTSVPRIRLQLSRWVKAGRLLRLRRGVYSVAPQWRRVEPHPFVVANALQRGSYVSLESALAFHGVIPEHVPVVTSAGCGRSETVSNPLGRFEFRHVGSGLLFGFSLDEVRPRQSAFVASAEKALLDLVHLTPGGDSAAYLRELRLQGSLDRHRIEELAQRSGRPKLIRAAQVVASLVAEEAGEELWPR